MKSGILITLAAKLLFVQAARSSNETRYSLLTPVQAVGNLFVSAPFCIMANSSLGVYESNPSMGISSANLFAINDLNFHTLCINVPYKKFSYSFGTRLLQNNIYHQSRTVANVAMSLSSASSLSIGASMQQLSIKNYGKAQTYNLRASFSSFINQNLLTSFKFEGLMLRNSNLHFREQREMNWGLSYKHDKNVLLLFQLNMFGNKIPDFSTDFVLKNDSNFNCSFGLNPIRKEFGFGFSFQLKNIKTILSFIYNLQLGFNSSIGFTYEFKK